MIKLNLTESILISYVVYVEAARYRMAMQEYNYILIYYRVVCPACESEFTSYEKYINHVFEKHENQPSLRMKAKIIKKEDNTDCLQTGET